MLYTLLGKKIGMTQVYDENNTLVPVTVIQAGPCPVLQVKTEASDGYNAIQIAFGERKPSRTSKAQAGHFAKVGASPKRVVREVRCQDAPDRKAGETLTVGGFSAGQIVDVIGVTKGKGFQGVVKKFGFGGGPASHGSMFHRRGGSYGMRQTPGHVFKNKKMPGHLGTDRRTVQNLTVVRIHEDENILFIRGSVPGSNGSDVIVRAAKKDRSRSA